VNQERDFELLFPVLRFFLICHSGVVVGRVTNPFFTEPLYRRLNFPHQFEDESKAPLSDFGIRPCGVVVTLLSSNVQLMDYVKVVLKWLCKIQ
jgi:hypothetical protein